jgi:hypothetical protein
MEERTLRELYEVQDDRTLKSCLRRYKAQAAEKRAIIERYDPGTPWRARAKHNLMTYQLHIAAIEQILRER